ncbi:putative ribonuclease H-like domain-containing protein [Tanacetum coccineum]|uniref:Ribonuclease H-like domain-containing protein n=1 Tax=Tanacetum coccineum TaxID=301880 RepID=A0ABQ5BXL6_9ASTR
MVIWETELTFFLGLQVQQRPDGIFISQDKYVQEILKKFDLECVRTATTPYEAPKPKSKNEPDISACSRNQVTPTTSNLEVVKKIFKYLKGQPRLGLWYPRESPFVLEAYSDSDYAGANKDRKSTTGGCQFLGRRLISWQCKKQTNLWRDLSPGLLSMLLCCFNCSGQTNGSRGSSVPSGVTRVPTGSFHFSYWLTTSYWVNMTQQSGIFAKTTGSDELSSEIIGILEGFLHKLGPLAILATIDETPYTVTEDSVRSQLQLADDGGIDDLPIAKIYSGMDNLGYVTEGKLTFYKNKFSPQWRFLVHTILHCLSTKSGTWDQFGSSLVVALICLSDRRNFNWSSYIFKGMLKTLRGKSYATTFRLHASLRSNSSDPNIASFSRVHESDDDPFTSTNVEDEPLGGSFHASPLRSTQAPPAISSHTSRSGQESPAMEGKLKGPRKEGGCEWILTRRWRSADVDWVLLLVLANAAVIVDSNIPPGGASSSHIPTNVPTGVIEDVRLGGGRLAQKRLHDEEQAQSGQDKESGNRRETTRKVEANASLSKTLLGDDVTEDNFPVRMAALIKRKKQALAEKLAKERMERPMTPAKVKSFMIAQLKEELRSPELEEPSSKQQKSTEATIPSVPDVPQPPVVSSPKSSGTRRKESSWWNDSTDEAPILWSALAGWEVISTPLGEINALYGSDQSTKHFTTLREILHMVDRQDLLKLYGMVVTYYENHLVAGAGLMLWGDLQVLIDSQEGDVSYPLSVKLMERMLKHKLEIDKDVVGNDMTTAEQLIRFIKNQIVAAQIVQLILFIVDSGCTKHIMGNLKLLCNFVEKYLETSSPTLIYFLAKASPTQAWLWHRRLSHLNFDTINLLSKKDIMNGLPKLKYVKDQLCSSCELSKAKRNTFKTKIVPSLKGRLNLLHMDLCGPMQIESINGKKYILVIVDDYSRYTWTHFLRTKEETPEVLKDLLKMIQRNIQAQVITVRTDRGTDSENLDKMKEKGDSCILVGYSTQSKGYRVYKKRTRLIVESIHINFDEIKELSKASDYDNFGPVPQLQKTSDHNHSELNIHDYINEPSCSTLVLNVSSPVDTNAPSI